MTKSAFSLFKGRASSLKDLTAQKLEDLLGLKILRRDLGELIIYLLIAVYTIVFSYFTILKYNAFRTYAWDLGINNQALWTTLNQGKLFYFTAELYLNPSGSFFGLHFSPILFLLLPVYAVRQAPETLLVFQSFIISLSALPLYWLTRDSLKSQLAAVCFSVTYLVYPPLQGVNWFDFHVQSFLPLFFLLAMYYLKNEKWTGYFTFVVFALAVAENVSIVVSFIGLYALWLYRKSLFLTAKERAFKDKRILIPLLTITLAISWFLIARWIQSAFFPINPEFSRLYKGVGYWSVLGIQGDPVVMPFYLILNPLKMFEAFAYEAYLKLVFIVLLFGSLLFLPLRSNVSLITLAWLVPALLSNYTPFYMIGAHYPAYIIPFIFTAAVYGMKKQVANPKVGNFGVYVRNVYVRNVLILGVIFSLFLSPLSPLFATMSKSVPYLWEYGMPEITEHQLILRKIIDVVPANASVLTQDNIFPHFSSRLNAYVYPISMALNYAQVYAPRSMSMYIDTLFNKSDYVLFDTLSDPYTSSLILGKIENDKNFGLFAFEDGIYLFKRGYQGEPVS